MLPASRKDYGYNEPNAVTWTLALKTTAGLLMYYREVRPHSDAPVDNTFRILKILSPTGSVGTLCRQPKLGRSV